jgi:hypothetical protein
MPNHVINEVLLRNVKLADCSQYLLDEEGDVSFAVLLPLPLNFWPGGVGIQHEKAFPGTHLDAARITWGTKWDAYGGPTSEDTEEGVVIRFQSAWNHPRGWTCALFNTLKCDIEVKWLSEGGAKGHSESYAWNRRNLKTGEAISNATWSQSDIEEGTEEHRYLHKLLWGVEEFPEENEDDSNEE